MCVTGYSNCSSTLSVFCLLPWNLLWLHHLLIVHHSPFTFHVMHPCKAMRSTWQLQQGYSSSTLKSDNILLYTYNSFILQLIHIFSNPFPHAFTKLLILACFWSWMNFLLGIHIEVKLMLYVYEPYYLTHFEHFLDTPTPVFHWLRAGRNTPVFHGLPMDIIIVYTWIVPFTCVKYMLIMSVLHIWMACPT
jgi:hypothetical protein